MSKGRCAGCGWEDGSAKKVRSHVASCPEYLRVWKEDRALALDPEDEYERVRAHKASAEFSEAREDKRTAKAEEYRAIMELRIARSKVRFKSHLMPREITLLELDKRDDIDLTKAGDEFIDGRYVIDVLADPEASDEDKDRALAVIRR